MKISTRSRYGVRLMLELAINYGKGPLFLKDIAKNEEISEKYLSQIVIPLKARRLVSSIRGAHGGYLLAKKPSQITIKEIVEALEGDLDLLECAKNPSVCKRNIECVSRNVWLKLSEKISKTLSATSLEDLVKSCKVKEEKIINYNI